MALKSLLLISFILSSLFFIPINESRLKKIFILFSFMITKFHINFVVLIWSSTTVCWFWIFLCILLLQRFSICSLPKKYSQLLVLISFCSFSPQPQNKLGVLACLLVFWILLTLQLLALNRNQWRVNYWWKIIGCRSSHPGVFLEKSILKICSKFTGKHPCRSVTDVVLVFLMLALNIFHTFFWYF